MNFLNDIHRIANALEAIAASAAAIAKDIHFLATPPKITGLEVKLSPDTKEPHMASPKNAKVKFTKKSAGLKSAPKGAAPVDGSFELQDDGSGTLTTYGVDTAGNGQIDLSADWTETATSSDAAKLVADPPSGMTVKIKAAAPPPKIGDTADLVIVATKNDGSQGPFTFTCHFTFQAGPLGGIVPVLTVP